MLKSLATATCIIVVPSSVIWEMFVNNLRVKKVRVNIFSWLGRPQNFVHENLHCTVFVFALYMPPEKLMPEYGLKQLWEMAIMRETRPTNVVREV